MDRLWWVVPALVVSLVCAMFVWLILHVEGRRAAAKACADTCEEIGHSEYIYRGGHAKDCLCLKVMMRVTLGED